MEHFYVKVAGRIEDLILAIVALGILVVSIEYVQLYLDYRDAIKWYDLLQRIVLFLTVVLFTSYYFIAYSAYFTSKHVNDSCKELSARRMVAMYINDLIQVTIASWPYAILLIGTLTSAPDKVSSCESITELNTAITLDELSLLFFFMLMWHATVLVWYFLAKGNAKDKWLHTLYGAVYALLSLTTSRLEGIGYWIWLFIAFYLAIVLSLYFTKGIPDIEASIKSHSE